MVFYEDLVKKVRAREIEKVEGTYKFGANISKLVANLGIGVPLILLGLFELYGATVNGFGTRSIIGVLVALYGIIIVANVLKYKLEIDTVKNHLKDKKIDIDLNKVALCELSKMAAPGGKRLEACLAFYTEDKKEIILPLIMRDKLKFITVIRKVLGEKFEIVEDK